MSPKNSPSYAVMWYLRICVHVNMHSPINIICMCQCLYNNPQPIIKVFDKYSGYYYVWTKPKCL